MDFRLGYVANCLSLDLSASHTVRVAKATSARLNELIALNLQELEQILLFNEHHGIQVYRIGSSLVPLASHRVVRVRWWQTFAKDLERIGKIARRSGQRLSLHPSPAGASLASARQEVRDAAIEELIYSTRVLDLLGQGPEARVVVHVGGAAPDRPTALASAHRFLDEMPDDARRRIVIEHDDRVWSAREVLPLATEHGLPLLADCLHNAVLPSTPALSMEQLFRMAARTWHALGLRPKHHIASQAPGRKPGAHSDVILREDWLRIRAALKDPADLMIEAKEKDFALFELRDFEAGLRQAELQREARRHPAAALPRFESPSASL
jgi:UV DNA damage endonuclease